jgi:ABC-type bacteriocin/lantibiotic exporter with double-glycine peptidase domain
MKKIVVFLLFLLISISVFAAPQWYKTQIGTGIGNCGPASVSMVMMWSAGINLTVQEIRQITGSPYDEWGSLDFSDLDKVLQKYNIPFKDLKDVESNTLVKSLLGWTLLIVVLDDSKIKEKNYNYDGNHYVVISGMKGNNFIVQDPWGGPDQLYNMEEVWDAMPYKEMIVIFHPRWHQELPPW